MHRHTVTEKQLAANRANAQKAGRPRGRTPPEILAANRIVMTGLVQRCRKNEEKHIQELERIALYGTSENARLTAIGMLLDRGHGRAVQHNDTSVTGDHQIIVYTGVPQRLPPPEIDGDYGVIIDDGMELGAAHSKNDELSNTPMITRHNPPWKR